jgi:3-hydroxybutyryl-CoA dehydrogenase
LLQNWKPKTITNFKLRILRLQLFADEPYLKSFSNYFSGIDGMELVSSDPDLVLGLTFLNPILKAEYLSKFETNVPIVSNTLTMSATTAKHALPNGATIIGMSVLPNYFARQKSVEYSLPVGVTEKPDVLNTFFTALNKTGEMIGDAIAGVFPRTLAMIINEAAFAVQESVATAADIDTAMKLGTNYPKGPLAWCDEIGAEAIVAVLDALAREYGSERYRVATLLRRHAESGMKFITSTGT